MAIFGSIRGKRTSAGVPYAEICGKVNINTSAGGGLYLDDSALAAAELTYIDGITAIGTAQASKAVVLDANKGIVGLGVTSVGTSNTSGVVLSNSITNALQVVAEDNGVSITSGNAKAIKGRLYIKANPGDCSLEGILGQVKFNTNITASADYQSGVRGYIELVGGNTVNTGGANANIGAGGYALRGYVTADDNLTISASHYLVGCGVQLSVKAAKAITTTGVLAGFGVFADDQLGGATPTQVWGYGLYIPNSVVTNGVYVGTSTIGLSLGGTQTTGLAIASTVTDAIKVTGTPTTVLNIDAGRTGIDFAGATEMTQNIILGGNGRVSTGSAAGAYLDIDATTSAYGEGFELKYAITDWADGATTLTEGTGLYVRMENRETNSGGSIYGAQMWGVSNNVANTQYLWGGLAYAYIKGAAGLTATGVYAFQPEISFDAATASSTIDEACVVRAKITGGTMADYTHMHGYKLIAGDMNGGSRTYGNAFWVIDDSAMSGTCGWTTGFNFAANCTTGIGFTAGTYTTLLNANAAVAAATTRGIFIGEDSDSAQSGIPLLGANWSTSQGNAFYCDDDGVALVNYTEAMTVRMLTTATVSSGDVSTVALHTDLTLNGSYAGTGGLSSIWGNTTIKSGKTINLSGSLGDVGGATFGIDIVGVLASNSHACGVSVGVGGSGTKNGILSGFRIRGATGTVDWDAVLSIEDGDGSWTSLTTAAASQTATMSNSPKSGNPAYWLSIYIGETKYCFPVWASA